MPHLNLSGYPEADFIKNVVQKCFVQPVSYQKVRGQAAKFFRDCVENGILVNGKTRIYTPETTRARFHIAGKLIEQIYADKLVDEADYKIVRTHFRFPKKQYWELKGLYEEKVQTRMRDPVSIHRDTILDLIDIAIENLWDKSWAKRTVALVVLTGRRVCEILQNGEIFELPSDSAVYGDELVNRRLTHVDFYGQRKSKRAAGDGNIIPFLGQGRTQSISASSLVDAWDDLRELTGTRFRDMNVKQFNDKTKLVRSSCHQMFPHIKIPDDTGQMVHMNCKAFRALYAAICIVTFIYVDRPEWQHHPIYYAQELLGHTSDATMRSFGTKTTKSYFYFLVTGFDYEDDEKVHPFFINRGAFEETL